jgi:hypothetical protein
MPFDYITNAAEFLLTSGINVMNTLFGEKFGVFLKKIQRSTFCINYFERNNCQFYSRRFLFGNKNAVFRAKQSYNFSRQFFRAIFFRANFFAPIFSRHFKIIIALIPGTETFVDTNPRSTYGTCSMHSLQY